MHPSKFLALLAALAAAALLAAMPAFATGDHAGEHGYEGGDHADTPCLAIDLDEETPRNRACDDLPHFKSSFINRVWTFRGAVDHFTDGHEHELSITLDAIEKLPARFRRQDDELLDQDTTVLVNERARVYDPDGVRIDHELLDDAEYVKVRGRLLAPRKWRENDDGDLVPTLRAKRVYVTEWSRRADSGGEDEVEPVKEEDDEARECVPAEDFRARYAC